MISQTKGELGLEGPVRVEVKFEKRGVEGGDRAENSV